MSKAPIQEKEETQALSPVSTGQIVKVGELVETGGTTAPGEVDGRVPPALLWVKDAPLFIDDQGLARFYDAVVRPAFKDDTPFKLKISESDKHDLEAKLGIKGKFGLSSWLSSILGAELEVSGEGADKKSKTKSTDQEITLEPISTPQRQLDQLLAFYVFNQPGRLLIGDRASPIEWKKKGASTAVPRALALIDLPPKTKMIPMAAEFENGKVVKLFEYLLSPSGEHPPPFVDEKKDEYWEWFAKNFNAGQAVEVIEKASGDNGKIEWIDFRVPLNEATGSPKVETMHLHLVARRRYFTGELAYMGVRRAMGHGLRVVGTLKDGPDINVLALYEK
jgi:hypothetical protein